MKFDVRHDGADSRRAFLAGLVALGAGAVLPGCQTAGGSAARFPDIRWIFSHSGGVTPFLLSRFQREEAALKDKSRLPNGLMHELRKFYYDTAQGNHEGALQALLSIIPSSQVLYGTDFPFRDGAEIIGGLAKHGFGAADRRAIDRDNALRLFPRLQA